MFVCLLAVDLGGKCNFEVAFPVVPTILELKERIIAVCSAEAAARRPGMPFEYHRAQVFDERMDLWVDLVASSQLEDYCQIYVFQKETQYHKEVPGRIPTPVKPTAVPVAAAAAAPYGATSPRMAVPLDSLAGGAARSMYPASPLAAPAGGVPIHSISPTRAADRPPAHYDPAAAPVAAASYGVGAPSLPSPTPPRPQAYGAPPPPPPGVAASPAWQPSPSAAGGGYAARGQSPTRVPLAHDYASMASAGVVGAGVGGGAYAPPPPPVAPVSTHRAVEGSMGGFSSQYAPAVVHAPPSVAPSAGIHAHGPAAGAAHSVGISPTRQVNVGAPAGAALGIPTATTPAAGANSKYGTGLTFADKVYVVYDELDAHKTQEVDIHVWSDLFLSLRLVRRDDGLTQETVEDLFQKADRDGDGFVSFAEFQAFAEHYPKVIECLHYRSRGRLVDGANERRVDQEQQVLDDLQRNYDRAQDATAEAERALAEAEAEIHGAEGVVDAAQAEDENLEAARRESHETIDALKAQLREARAAQAAARDAYKRVEIAKKSAEHAVVTLQKRHKTQVMDRDRAVREMERLRRLLEEQEAEVQRKEAAINDTEYAIEDAQKKVEMDDDPELRGQREAADHEVEAVERELQAAVDGDTALQQEARQRQQEVQRSRAVLTRATQNTHHLQQVIQQKRDAEDRISAQVAQQQTVLDDMQLAEAEEATKRYEEESRENALVQMEVRIREEREAVEKKEEALRSAHLSFTEESGRSSPRRTL